MLTDKNDLAATADEMLASVIRRDPLSWPSGWDSAEHRTKFLDRVVYHGVTVLLLPVPASWPIEIAETLRRWAKLQAHWELRHHLLLGHLVRELAGRKVRSLFLKGTALAYLTYQEPTGRGRGDSDLLVHPNDLDQARSALEALGFACPAGPKSRKSASLQENWVLELKGQPHVVDLHWATFNSPFLARILSIEEAFSNVTELPRLAPDARTLSVNHLLLHVCIHRGMHRTAPVFSRGGTDFSADRLIWATDIRNLTAGFNDRDWSAFVSLAVRKRISRAVLESLSFATTAAGARIPDSVLNKLRSNRGREDRSDYLLASDRRSRVLANFRALDAWQERARYLWSQMSPDHAQLRERYPQWAAAPRPLLLARRLVDFITAKGARGRS